MNRSLIIYIPLLFLSGCTATMVTSPGTNSRSRYAPVNESSRGGIIKYSNQGASFVIAQRREDAYKKMYDACGGKYRIISEGPRAEGGAAMPTGNMMLFTQNQYIYIEFECIDSGEQE